MVDLCSLLHHSRQSDLADLKPSKEASLRILELCVLADTYDCIGAFRLSVEALFSRFATISPANCSSKPLCNLAAASYAIKNAGEIRRFTEELVMIKKKAYLPLLPERSCQVLPLLAICKSFPTALSAVYTN